MSATLVKIVPREYRDSVSLMQLSALLGKLPGVEQASAVMATENNLALLAEAGLRVDAKGASASDLLIVVQGEKSALPAAIEEAMKSLTRQPEDSVGEARTALRPRTPGMRAAKPKVPRRIASQPAKPLLINHIARWVFPMHGCSNERKISEFGKSASPKTMT